MNLDITISLSVFGYWFRITLLELDADKKWGYSLGIFRIGGEGRTKSNIDERSLLFINKTKYMTKIDLAFIRLYEKYK